MSVGLAQQGIVLGTQFHGGHIAEAQHIATRQCHCFGIGSCIGSRDADGGWGDVRKLFYGQLAQSNQSDDDKHDGDDTRQDGAVYESLYSHGLLLSV